MKQNSLKQKAVSGIIWAALQRYSVMFIAFISGIILARLLSPHDYGCIGMLAIFIALAQACCVDTEKTPYAGRLLNNLFLEYWDGLFDVRSYFYLCSLHCSFL